MSRPQYELRYFIGYQTGPHWRFDQSIIKHASALCGGCFVSDGTGYWIDGETHAERFIGAAEQEYCLAISITTEPEKLAKVLASMQEHISEQVVKHGLPIEWIHVQRLAMNAEHFNVQQQIATKASKTQVMLDMTHIRPKSKPIGDGTSPAFDMTLLRNLHSGYSQNRGDA